LNGFAEFFNKDRQRFVLRSLGPMTDGNAQWLGSGRQFFQTHTFRHMTRRS